MNKKIYLGADHAGFDLKTKIMGYLKKEGCEVCDCGNTIYDASDDYIEFAKKVSTEVVKHNAMGILICGTGSGMCITANKIKGIRAVNTDNVEIAKLTRQHNDSNILCLAGRFIDSKKAKEVVKAWLETEFSNMENHIRRIKKISGIENS